ncbi:unnamed protein product [Linum trigynum]|uniref:Uncharacterized protein n=1 Tax=Linum trigynum TaxID=586398 RepID=A0AAV2CRN3_9ROSI
MGSWASLEGWVQSCQISGLPIPSLELGQGVLMKIEASWPPRMEGNALGWLHRAAITSLSRQWKDYGLVALGLRSLSGCPN